MCNVVHFAKPHLVRYFFLQGEIHVMLKASLKGLGLPSVCSAMLLTCNVQGQTPRLRVAVYPFGQAAVEANIEKETGMKVNYGEIATQLLVGELISQVDVINRDQMERILAEQGRKYDERFDAAKAPEFGKLLGVEAIVAGNIIALSAEQNSGSGAGGKATAVGGIFGGKTPKVNTDSTVVNVKVQVTASMISTVTGSTLGSFTEEGAVSKKTSGKFQINDKGSNDTSTSKSGYDPYIREALQVAVKKIGAQFASAFISAPRGVPAKTTEVTSRAPAPAVVVVEPKAEPEYLELTNEVGNVYKLDGAVLMFFLAPGAKLAKGDLLEVQHAETAKNPRTGEVVVFGQTLGNLKVTEILSEKMGEGAYQGKPATDKDRLVKKQANAAAPGREHPTAKPTDAKQ
jgi:curli biogenesis system outer membrane secretion channel CsgG